MEEKKSITINLTTLLLAVAIIIIAIMGYFIYNLSNEKQNAIAEAQNLNNQVANLESTVSNLQSTINNVSNAINSSTNSTDNLQSANITNCKYILQNYLKLTGHAEGSPINLAIDLGFMRYNSIDFSNTIEDGKYILTDVEFNTFENELKKYATEECIQKNLKMFYKEYNNNVAFLNTGTSGMDSIITNMTLVSATNTTEIYTVEYTYELEDYSLETLSLTATMHVDNNNYLVSDISYNN